MLKILSVQVRKDAFIDGGAAPTLASRSLINKLGLKGRPCMQFMRTECGDFICDQVVQLTLSNLDKIEDIVMDEDYVSGKISVTTDHMMLLNLV